MNELYNNLAIFSLKLSFLIYHNSNAFFKTQNGLWKDFSPAELRDEVRGNRKYQILDNVSRINLVVERINATSNNQISLISPKVNGSLVKVSIKGDKTFINTSRSEILKHYGQVIFKEIGLSKQLLDRIDSKFLDILSDISKYYNVEVVIDNTKTDFKTDYFKVKKIQKNHSIYILGFEENVTTCYSQVKILIDTHLNKYHLDCIKINLSMIPLIGGPDLFNFTQIALQLKANIYIPDLLPEIFNSNTYISNFDLDILITAKEIPDILVVKHIISNLISQCKSELFVKELDVTKGKLDLITLQNQQEILNIMFNHGTFIQLPSLGELNNSQILVQGNSTKAVEDTIEELNSISAEYYSLSLLTHEAAFNPEFEYTFLDLIHLNDCSSIVYNKYGMDIIGKRGTVNETLRNMSANKFFWTKSLNKFDLKLRIELSNHQRDFISGKKNGKIVKILNQLNQEPAFKFTAFNEYKFFVDICVANEIATLLRCINLFELELPAELQFNIPEVFHKSIIGNGGSIIQSIMKRYNVFIKFSSSVKMAEGLLYSFKRFNNVLIKCPQKNAANIALVKQELDEIVKRCCYTLQPFHSSTTIYNNTNFQLLKSHYSLLINNDKLRHVSNLEFDMNTFIQFPSSLSDFEGNSFIVSIKGSDTRSEQCALKLKELLPHDFEFQVTFSPNKFSSLIGNGNEEFKNRIQIPFKLLLGVEVLVNETPIGFSKSAYHQIILSGFDQAKLNEAIYNMTMFLREKDFLILDKKEFLFNPIMYNHEFIKSPLKQISNFSNNVEISTKNQKLYHETNLLNHYNNNNNNILIPPQYMNYIALH